MPVLDAPIIRCPKCDSTFNARILQHRETYVCCFCKEPLRELIDLAACSWEEGDFNAKAFEEQHDKVKMGREK